MIGGRWSVGRLVGGWLVGGFKKTLECLYGDTSVYKLEVHSSFAIPAICHFCKKAPP